MGLILQKQMFSDCITVVDDNTGFEIAEINGSNLNVYGRGWTICKDPQDAIEQVRAMLISPNKPKNNTNQINLL